MTYQLGCRIYRFLVATIAVAVLGSVGILAYWFVVNTFTASTAVMDIQIVGSSVVQPGSSLNLQARFKRNRDCSIDVYRMIKRADGGMISNGSDLQVQHVMRAFKAGRSYHVAPISVDIPSFVTPGKYILFSRLRYICNGLDLVWPRYLLEPSVEFTVD